VLSRGSRSAARALSSARHADLQFAFDGSRENPYIPHRHTPLSVVYTGTHDNDTTLGWYDQLEDETRLRVQIISVIRANHARPLLRAALASVAQLRYYDADLLELDSAHRMNIPGTSSGNWCWQFDWPQVPEELSARLRQWLSLYGRL